MKFEDLPFGVACEAMGYDWLFVRLREDRWTHRVCLLGPGRGEICHINELVVDPASVDFQRCHIDEIDCAEYRDKPASGPHPVRRGL
jgi:hypothetical protein